MADPKPTRSRRPRLVILLAALTLGLSTSALATSPHQSPYYVNNGCKWLGYHEYSATRVVGITHEEIPDTSGFDCAEVSVKIRVNGVDFWGYHLTYAVATVDGSGLVFTHSDHNADPPGVPPYVGFRMF